MVVGVQRPIQAVGRTGRAEVVGGGRDGIARVIDAGVTVAVEVVAVVSQALPARPTPMPNCIGPAAPARFQPERTPGSRARPWSDSTLPTAARTAHDSPGQRRAPDR